LFGVGIGIPRFFGLPIEFIRGPQIKPRIRILRIKFKCFFQPARPNFAFDRSWRNASVNEPDSWLIQMALHDFTPSALDAREASG
jgi:hypothetical protein